MSSSDGPFPPPLALVVPFHNEDRYLPSLIASLRRQRQHGVPIVFVDNGSRDCSRMVLERCPEVAAGIWHCVAEPRVGKFHAMRTGAALCAERFGVAHVGFVDADSYFAGDDWLSVSVATVDARRADLAYTYSPFRYQGIEHLPVFARAYAAYEQVLFSLVARIGWLANGLGFVVGADTAKRYFERARVTTEIDLRMALLALSEGRRAYLNPALIMTSARRTLVNAQNFAAWCFYEPRFYSGKDVNAPVKLDLGAPAAVDDLPPEVVGHFFARRALKLVARHLMPWAIFDQHAIAALRIGTVLGIELPPQTLATFAPFTHTTHYLFSERFEAMIEAITRHPISAALAQRIADLMHDRYHTGLGDVAGSGTAA